MSKPKLIELAGSIFSCGVWVKNWDVAFESQKDEIEQTIQTFRKLIEKNNLEKDPKKSSVK